MRKGKGKVEVIRQKLFLSKGCKVYDFLQKIYTPGEKKLPYVLVPLIAERLDELLRRISDIAKTGRDCQIFVTYTKESLSKCT